MKIRVNVYEIILFWIQKCETTNTHACNDSKARFETINKLWTIIEKWGNEWWRNGCYKQRQSTTCDFRSISDTNAKEISISFPLLCYRASKQCSNLIVLSVFRDASQGTRFPHDFYDKLIAFLKISNEFGPMWAHGDIKSWIENLKNSH